MKRSQAPLLVLVLSASACSGSSPEEHSPTYHRDAKAVLNRYCNDCHQLGGIAPFELTDYATARQHAPAIRDAVEAGRMPPWMPSDAGVPLAYSRKMRPQDRQLLLRWIELGAPEGDPAEPPRQDIPPLPTVQPPRPDLVLQAPEVYVPQAGRADDYRCFVFDPKLEQDVFVQAGMVRPDNRAIVHHVLVFEVPAESAQRVRDKDAAEPGLGYTCFGGPGGGWSVRTVMGWAPGGVPQRTANGIALRLRKGSLLVMQVHYNLINFKGVGDRTETVLELSPTPPQKEAFLVPLANPRELKIKAGDPEAKQVVSVPVGLIQSFLRWPPGEMTVWANAPHMHLLGTRIVTLVEDGPILVEIPRWDFHWQASYTFQEPYVLRQSDTLRVECTWDNSAANPNQHTHPPRDITWGEGTTDEMCLSYLLITPGGLSP